eukprot:1160203-Pelagomonas_calceolata.AAC.4
MRLRQCLGLLAARQLWEANRQPPHLRFLLPAVWDPGSAPGLLADRQWCDSGVGGVGGKQAASLWLQGSPGRCQACFTTEEASRQAAPPSAEAPPHAFCAVHFLHVGLTNFHKRQLRGQPQLSCKTGPLAIWKIAPPKKEEAMGKAERGTLTMRSRERCKPLDNVNSTKPRASQNPSSMEPRAMLNAGSR